jgi:hypothetical protein
MGIAATGADHLGIPEDELLECTRTSLANVFIKWHWTDSFDANG